MASAFPESRTTTAVDRSADGNGMGDGTTNFRFGDSLNKIGATNRARVVLVAPAARPPPAPGPFPFLPACLQSRPIGARSDKSGFFYLHPIPPHSVLLCSVIVGYPFDLLEPLKRACLPVRLLPTESELISIDNWIALR